MELFRLLGTILIDSTQALQKIAEINTKTKKTSEDMAKSFKNIGEKSIKMGQKLKWVSVGAGTAFGSMVKFASDTEEATNKVDVAFGKSSKEVKKFARNALTNFGIAKGSAMDMAALFGDMGTSMGLSQKEAAKMSTSLVGLAGDLASFKNIGIDQATTALNGIFTGETESLKTLGIVMTQTNLDAFALANGFGKTTSEMTQSEQVALRYAYVMDKTKNAQGDFARTGDSTANQLRKFQEGLKELASSFGEVVLPYVAKAVDVANRFIQAFSKAPEPVKQLTVGIVGLLAIASPFLIVFGTMCSGIGSMISLGSRLEPVVTRLIGVIKGLNLAFLANPVFLVVAGIVALVAAIVIAYKRSEKFREIVNKVGAALKEVLLSAMEKVKPVILNVVGAVQSAIAIFNSLKKTVSNVFGAVYNTIKSKMDSAKSKITSIVGKIKSIFNGLKLKLDLKIPKISISGGKAPWGIGGKGKLPYFDVKWNAEGAIFDKPTIFATSQGFQGVGEAGAEAVTPISTLQKYVESAVASQNSEMVKILYDILVAIKQMDAGIYQNIEAALDNRKIQWNDRELGRFVKNYA